MKLIGVSSVAGSKLDAACDEHVMLPLQRELCPFDLAPVTSTAIQLAFGDICAFAVSRAKRVTPDAYAMNHPAGKVGKRLILKVQDLMRTSDLPTCSAGAPPRPPPQTPKPRPPRRAAPARDAPPNRTPAAAEPLLETLRRMSAVGLGCLLVVDAEGRLQGAFTDGDLRRALSKHQGAALRLTMGELMTRSPRTVERDSKAYDALKRMERPSTVRPRAPRALPAAGRRGDGAVRCWRR